jgi:regulator of sigma E protease
MKKPIFVNSKGTQYYFTLTPKVVNAEQSLEEIQTQFKGKGYLYPFKLDGEKVVLEIQDELEIATDPTQSLVPFLTRMEFFPVDLSVKNVVMGSPADKAGFRKNDIITSFDGKPLSNFEELRVGLQDLPEGKSVLIGVLSQAKASVKSLIPKSNEVDKKKIKIIGVESSVEYLQPKLVVAKADSIGSAIVTAFSRTWDGVVKTFSGYKKLLTREVSLNNIGGPLAIGKVASDSFNISLSMFFRLMAIISINLGVINLFPIPVLDGGHIMFLVFEALNGGPLSRRKLEIAQRLGVSVLFLLIFVALFNDISRLF